MLLPPSHRVAPKRSLYGLFSSRKHPGAPASPKVSAVPATRWVWRSPLPHPAAGAPVLDTVFLFLCPFLVSAPPSSAVPAGWTWAFRLQAPALPSLPVVACAPLCNLDEAASAFPPVLQLDVPFLQSELAFPSSLPPPWCVPTAGLWSRRAAPQSAMITSRDERALAVGTDTVCTTQASEPRVRQVSLLPCAVRGSALAAMGRLDACGRGRAAAGAVVRRVLRPVTSRQELEGTTSGLDVGTWCDAEPLRHGDRAGRAPQHLASDARLFAFQVPGLVRLAQAPVLSRCCPRGFRPLAAPGWP